MIKFVDPEPKLPLPLNLETSMCFLVLSAGLVQGMMSATTNWARKEYEVPWPHTFGQDKNKNKLKFDMVQRAHLNFVENFTRFLAVAFFACKMAPKLSTIFGSVFLLGRVVFAKGYYSGNAAKK